MSCPLQACGTVTLNSAKCEATPTALEGLPLTGLTYTGVKGHLLWGPENYI